VNLLSLWRRRLCLPIRRPLLRLRLENLEPRTLFSVDLGQIIEGMPTASYIPPDTSGAVGPSYFIETINTKIAYYDKYTGAQTQELTFQSFFAPLGQVMSLSDPVICYDDYNQQFVVGIIDFDRIALSQARFDFAVSNDSDPNDGWQFYSYDMRDGGNRTLNDYPKMGYNADAYVISFNMFPNGGSFNHVDTLSIDKSTFTGYRNIVPGGTGNFTLVPAVMHDANPGDPEWLVEDGTTPTTVKVCEMSNVLSFSPNYQFFTVNVPAHAQPPDATQLGGGTIPVSGLGTRFYDASERFGRLVASHTIGTGGVGSVAHARWYEFDISQGNPTLVQASDINPGPGVHTYFPTIEVNGNGDLGMTYMESSPTEYMSMYVTGQAFGDAANTMQDGAVTHPGIGRYTLSRVGDYSEITVDPNDLTTFWAANEYKGASAFNTGIASFTVSSDSQVVSATQQTALTENGTPERLASAPASTATTSVAPAGQQPILMEGTRVEARATTAEIRPLFPMQAAPVVDPAQDDWYWAEGLS
jgi:hypothetical protein